jgi:Dephospho-CoA kinase
MIKIGLTGSIGSGKTTVLNLFKNYGFLTVNLDEEAKKIYKKNSLEYKKIVDFFGNKILNKDYDIDRGVLAGIIFSDISKKKVFRRYSLSCFATKDRRISCRKQRERRRHRRSRYYRIGILSEFR